MPFKHQYTLYTSKKCISNTVPNCYLRTVSNTILTYIQQPFLTLTYKQGPWEFYTEPYTGSTTVINPVLDYFTLRRYEEVYKKKAIGIVTSNLQDLQKDLSNHIVWASQAKDSIKGMAARFPLQKLVEVRRGLTEEDTLVVHCVQAASSEALREAQLYRRELNIALMSQKHQWNSEYTGSIPRWS